MANPNLSNPKSTLAAREQTGRNKVDYNLDPTEDERLQSQGGEAYRQPVQQPTRPASVTPEVVTKAEEARVSARSAAEFERGTQAPSSQGARSGPVRGGGGGRGGSGGGSGFKGNRGFKGATPFDPYSSMNLNVYAKGGQVGKVGSFGMKRSKPDFAGGGSKTNFKMSTKKGDMPW